MNIKGSLAARSISTALFGLGVILPKNQNIQRLGLNWLARNMLCLDSDSSAATCMEYVVLGLVAPQKLLKSNKTGTRSAGTNQSRKKGNSTSEPAANLKEKVYNRYTPDQNQVLEEFYCRNPHPDANDRKQLGEALGFTDDRIKYWFQNRRAVDRRKSNKSLNEQLKEKNDILRIEIETSKLTLLLATCESGCMEHPEGGSSASSSSSSSIERLMLENACLKDMIDKMNKQLEKYSGIERRYSSDPDDGNQQPAEGPSNPGISITEPLSDEINPDLFFDHNEEAHRSLD